MRHFGKMRFFREAQSKVTRAYTRSVKVDNSKYHTTVESRIHLTKKITIKYINIFRRFQFENRIYIYICAWSWKKGKHYYFYY